MALVLLFEDLVLRSVEPFELPGDEFVRAVTSASKTVKEKKGIIIQSCCFLYIYFLFCFILPSLTRLTASGTGAICPFFRSSSPSITVEFRCNWPNSSEGGRPLLLDRPLFRTAATPEIPRKEKELSMF